MRSRFFWFKLFFAAVITAFASPAFAQEETATVAIKARPFEQSVWLRWAPTTPMSWEVSNEYGYRLERYTIVRDGKTLATPEKKILTPDPLKPVPLTQWNELVDRNKYAAIAAQAIFGETFELEDDWGNDIMQVVNKAKESQLRFSFALSAADYSREVARQSALFFEDHAVQANEKYLYKIYSLAPQDLIEVDTGYVFTSVMEAYDLPKPIGLDVEFGDHSALIRWNYLSLADMYGSYLIERSDDQGKTYHSLTDDPIVFAFDEEGPLNPFVHFTDSLPENGVTYSYRLKGLSYFGETSPPSDTVSGLAVPSLGLIPSFEESFSPDNESVRLSWKVDKEVKEQLQSYEVLRAPKADGPYRSLDTLSVDQMQFTDRNPRLNNYYKLKITDAYGQSVSSLPALVQLVDSIPPSIPQGLEGKVMPNGDVILKWKANQDEDLKGYRIYRSNSAHQEFSLVTNRSIPEASYQEKLDLKNLSSKIFYKIVAVDLRENHSEFSEIIQLTKPDIVPPVSPVFKEVKALATGIMLKWENSHSRDVNAHVLYRKEKNADRWVLLQAFSSGLTMTEYLDEDTEEGTSYYYTMIAVDQSGLESQPAKPVLSVRLKQVTKAPIEAIYTNKRIKEKELQMQWEYDATDILKYEIYKQTEANDLTLYKVIPAGVKEWIDKEVKAGKNYVYRIRAVFTDGTATTFSKEIKVNF